MKKGVLFIIFILVMTNLILAHQCNEGNPNIHGVYIGGQCFNCGDVDDICPEDFGSDCSLNPDPDCVGGGPISEAFWSLDNTTSISDDPLEINQYDGKILYMVITNTGLADGTIVNFEVYEDDGILLGGDDLLNTIQGNVSGGKAIGIFNIVGESSLQGEVEDIYTIFFDVDTGDTSSTLNINTTDSGGSSIETTCADYSNNIACLEDAQNVGTEIIISGDEYQIGCFRDEQGTGCDWDYDLEVCKQISEYIYSESNPEETCDESVASCSYVEEGKTECTAGEDAFVVSYTSSDIGCESWTSAPIPCPQELKVPFFGVYNFIVTLCFISLIYVYLIFRKK